MSDTTATAEGGAAPPQKAQEDRAVAPVVPGRSALRNRLEGVRDRVTGGARGDVHAVAAAVDDLCRALLENLPE